MTDEVDPKVMAEIREHVYALAEMDYPRVWVGSFGITPEELLQLQEMNDEGPEWLRVEPEELGGVSVDWIDGAAALRYIPDHFVENMLGNLQEEVGVIQAAKLGAVRVQRAYTLGYVTGADVEALSEDDRLFFLTAWWQPDGEPAAIVFTGSSYHTVPLDDLTAADVDKHLIETLRFYASGDTMGPYVVDDTPRARALVEARLGS